jgi:hypothetical protein
VGNHDETHVDSDALGESIERLAGETRFSGVVRVDRCDAPGFARAYGFADRAHGIANTTDTQFGVASATKGLTALAVVSLIEEGRLDLGTTARPSSATTCRSSGTTSRSSTCLPIGPASATTSTRRRSRT